MTIGDLRHALPGTLSAHVKGNRAKTKDRRSFISARQERNMIGIGAVPYYAGTAPLIDAYSGV